MGGNPLSYVDPNGMLFIDPTGTIPDDTTGPGKVRGESRDDCHCLEKLLGIGAVGTTMVSVGQPTVSKPFVTPGTSPGTSPISEMLSKALPHRLPFRVPAPTAARPLATSPVLGRVLGRWIPWIGWGLTAEAIREYIKCVQNCHECTK